MRHDRRSIRPLRLALIPALAFAVTAPLAAQDAAADRDYAARMHREHAHETPTPSAAVAPAPAQKLVVQEVEYATIGGQKVRGHLARPLEASGPLPGLIVIQEWWGLNDNIRAMADRFAGEGYLVLAVDLYEGKVATTSDAAMANVQAAMKDPARLLDNLKQAQAYLKGAGAAKVGVVGWCFGGGWALETALELGDGIAATVMYYGRVQTDPAEIAKLKSPLLGLFGALDQGIPVAGVRQFEAALQAAGRNAEIVVYEGADHAFANPSGSRYQEAAATDAWRRTTAFLAKFLKG
jgi:carboxymethylenebutenolidase